jgi:predicted DNA-binding protein (UPF0251 family)
VPLKVNRRSCHDERDAEHAELNLDGTELIAMRLVCEADVRVAAAAVVGVSHVTLFCCVPP